MRERASARVRGHLRENNISGVIGWECAYHGPQAHSDLRFEETYSAEVWIRLSGALKRTSLPQHNSGVRVGVHVAWCRSHSRSRAPGRWGTSQASVTAVFAART
eukprot:15440464-Alexandrium_andersonii.AAC.1